MTRAAYTQQVSPHISGGIFSQRSKGSKLKQEPRSNEIIRDYGELLDGVMRAFTEVVNRTFPNADFLQREHVDGSNIEKDTKLSVVICTVFNLLGMTLPPELVKNYHQTLKKYLDNIKNNQDKKREYTELLNIIKTYKKLASAVESHKKITNELVRLIGLYPEASRSVESYLRRDWIEPCIQQPVADLTAQVAKTMRSSERLQSAKLAGQNNSLASLSNLVSIKSKTQKPKLNETVPQIPKNKVKSYEQATAPAA